MIKKLFIYISLIVSFAACSDDIFNAPDVISMPEDGKISVKLALPEMEDMTTRDFSEWTIKDMLILIFDGEDGALKQIEKVDLKDISTETVTSYSFDITVDEDLRKTSGLQFVALANSGLSKSSISKETKLSTLRNGTDCLNVTNAEGMIMSGTQSLSNMLKFEPVNMLRNGAKVSVSRQDGEIKEENKYPIAVYGTAIKSSLFAGAYNMCATSEKTKEWNHNPAEGPVYVHPSKNTDRYVSNCYAILKVPYLDGKEYYYRVDFQTPTEGFIDLIPNHHYEFIVTGNPKNPGFESLKEAAASPTPMDNDWVVMHDHAPVIYNMITDGQHELGVSHQIIYTGEPAVDNDINSATRTFKVKLLSKSNPNEENDLNTSESDDPNKRDGWKSYFSKADYISLESCTKVESPDSLGNDVPDTNDKGTVYEVKIKFNKTMNTGTLESVIRVVWRGLVREIPVIWDRSFDASQLISSAELKVTDPDGTGSFSSSDFYSADGNKMDYFTFLKEKVYGVSKEANNGNERDKGFHFPLQYGESGKLWSYEYTVQFNDLMNGESEYDYEIFIDGGQSDDEITKNIKLSKKNQSDNAVLSNNEISGHCARGTKPIEFKLSREAKGWNYGVGKLCVRVQPNAETDWTYYHIDLYHTGFFHKDAQNGKISGGANPVYSISGDVTGHDFNKYTYYEVVSIGEGSDRRYWLDRNLGAHSAEYYIKSSTGQTYYGNPEAQGFYYRVAEYNKHNDPNMREGICPPGYDYPTVYEFDLVKNNPLFHTDAVGNHYDASYTMDYSTGNQAVATQLESDVKKKIVYFPRAMYNAPNQRGTGATDVLSGESRGGYYWTRTAAMGMEKQEIGAWLKAFNLSGSAASYVNAAVYSIGYTEYKVGDNDSRCEYGYAMPVRCIQKGASEPIYNRTHFSVTGATHVYLYTADGTPVQPWPGINICDHNTSDRTFNLSYESKVFTSDKLYVIFNYKDANGIIHTLSKASDTSALCTTNKGPKDLEGWKVTGGPDGKAPKVPGSTETKEASLGCEWYVNHDDTDPSKCYVTLGIPTKYRVYFAYDSNDFKGIYLWVPNGSVWVNDNTWDGNGTYNNASVSTNPNTPRGTGRFVNDGNYTYFEYEQTELLKSDMKVQIREKNNYQAETDIYKSMWTKIGSGIYAITLHDNDMVAKGIALPKKGLKRVYFYAPDNWSDVYIYAWIPDPNNNNNTVLTLMSKDDNISDGRWRYIDIDLKYTYVLFRNNNNFNTTTDAQQTYDQQYQYGKAYRNLLIRYFSTSPSNDYKLNVGSTDSKPTYN